MSGFFLLHFELSIFAKLLILLVPVRDCKECRAGGIVEEPPMKSTIYGSSPQENDLTTNLANNF